jgi:hypothetical protein
MVRAAPPPLHCYPLPRCIIDRNILMSFDPVLLKHVLTSFVFSPFPFPLPLFIPFPQIPVHQRSALRECQLLLPEGGYDTVYRGQCQGRRTVPAVRRSRPRRGKVQRVQGYGGHGVLRAVRRLRCEVRANTASHTVPPASVAPMDLPRLPLLHYATRYHVKCLRPPLKEPPAGLW